MMALPRRAASRLMASWALKSPSLIHHRCISIASPAVSRRVETMVARHKVVLDALNSGEISASLGKELSRLAPVVSLDETLEGLRQERESFEELLAEAESTEDGDMKEECRSEIVRIDEEMDKVGAQVVDAILPTDADDFGTGAVLEVRAGSGGDEAALFAAELLAAYEKTAKAKGWKFESLGRSLTDLGGIKDAAISIHSSGGYSSYSDDSDSDWNSLDRLGPYGLYKFESGVHRVQRVPVNDVRMHTSAASVAVLPAPDNSSNDPSEILPMSELKIDTFRASGAGGQHVNTTESAVRITHLPTGITAAIQDERSQHKNKAKALKLVSARVHDKKREDEARERGDARNSLMGGGDRSERIRTYNFPQDRVTDHRCKHSEHGIAKIFDSGGEDGLVATFAPFMRSMHREEMLQEMEEE